MTFVLKEGSRLAIADIPPRALYIPTEKRAQLVQLPKFFSVITRSIGSIGMCVCELGPCCYLKILDVCTITMGPLL